MTAPNPDDALLLIRCPSCGQRFKVGEDLRGRTVECGGCEHRFRINDDVIVRGRKFYPGERKDASLNRFHRVPLSVAPAPVGVPSVQYIEPPSSSTFEPTPPQRVLAGIVGVAGMVFIALLLMFGSSSGGILDGMTTDKRIMMAGFTGLLGLLLLLYANPRSRMKAILFGLLMGGGLVALPLIFTEGSVPLGPKADAPVVVPDIVPNPGEAAEKAAAALRERINTRPLDDEIARLRNEGSNKHAYGIWLRDMSSQNRYQVRDYLQRRTASESHPHPYPRGRSDFLMVVPATTRTLDEVAEIAADLGSIEAVYPEVSVVEVHVNNDKFVEGPIEKLSNPNDPAFYDLNKRELECVDLGRVNRAVKRLATAEPKVYRSDITRKLITLLGADWVDFKGDVCGALAVWSDQPGVAAKTALVQVANLVKLKQEVPIEMIALIVKEKNTDVVPFLAQLWREDPLKWETLFGDVGPAAEPSLIEAFPTTTGSLRQSAVRILGRVGSAASLTVLESAAEGADSELKVLVEKSVASINGRISQ